LNDGQEYALLPVFSQAFTSRILPITVILLVIFGVFIPVRYSEWARPFGWLATALVAPVSHPFAAFSRWVAPADRSQEADQRIVEMTKRLEEAERELRRVQQENKQLLKSLEELNVLGGLNNAPVRQVFAPIFASSSDLSSNIIRARAGRSEGVDVNSVATASGMQLLGRIIATDERTSDIALFNAKGAEPINAMIMIDASANGLMCRLTPAADGIGTGLLKGPVEDRRDPVTAGAIDPVVGQFVRLWDGRWPQSAQMLLVGKVIAVEPSPDSPLRKIVTVRPTIERIERVSEAVIRTTIRDEVDTTGDRARDKASGGGKPR